MEKSKVLREVSIFSKKLLSLFWFKSKNKILKVFISNNSKIINQNITFMV